jgi:hypothetical protein
MATRKNLSLRRRVRHAVAAVTVLTLGTIGVAAAPALAAPRAGCPSSEAGWKLASVEDVTRAISGSDTELYDQLFPSIDALDRNDDEDLCLAMRWGADLNPKSYWFRLGMELIGQPFDLFIPIDNVARAR